jgi:CBS domain-containing protein
MQVKDVMIPAVGHVSPNDSLRDAAEQMKALNLSPMPVVQDGKVVGILTEQILLDHVRSDGLAIGAHRVADAMSTEVLCCREDEPLDQALGRIEEGHTGRLPVIDERHHLVGIVSHADLQRGLRVDSGETAVSEVEAISDLVPFEEDSVDFMSDSSFPASDPIPPPTALGRGDEEADEPA